MRQSNIELLRIVSMFLIVLEHILIVGTSFFTAPVGNQLIAANTIIGFTYIGVNCYILITGYFGSDFSWKRLLSIYLICFFYELIGFLIAFMQGDVEWSTAALSYIIFPLSHSNSWFIRCYVILLLLLPVINAGLEHFNKRQYLFALALLTILNLYFGWFQKQPDYNGNGYNASQMIYLYVIGRYLNRYLDWEHIRKYRKYLLLAWVLLSVLWGVVQNINDTVRGIPHWNGWAYNNPLVIASAMLFFSYFRCLEIKPSKYVNLIGGTMLGVFLLHLNRYICGYIYNMTRYVIHSSYVNQSLILQVVALIGLALGLLVVLALIDLPRLYIHKWLMKTLTRKHIQDTKEP